MAEGEAYDAEVKIHLPGGLAVLFHEVLDEVGGDANGGER